ncbi:MAG: hypothetical protein RLZZ413_446, partial [Pseudomonadota bacterium]
WLGEGTTPPALPDAAFAGAARP